MSEIEEFLTSLYASEINVSLVWSWDRGFCARLGDPPLAENWFDSSGEAVRWLKEQALIRYPGAEFASERNRSGVGVEAILNDLHASRINGSIEWIWDGGFYVSLGTRNKTERWSLETIAEAAEWLKEEACRRYPNSKFARKYGGFV